MLQYKRLDLFRKEQKLDRRQKKTKSSILSAFGKLLANSDYSKITVQDIIEEANIGRSTFYAHFATKDHLLEEICSDLFEHILSDSLRAEGSHDFSSHRGSMQTNVTHILYHLRDGRKDIITLLKYDSNELFLHHFRQHLSGLVREDLAMHASYFPLNIPESFWINHISCSFVGMVQWWIAGNFAQTPEYLSSCFIQALYPTIKSQDKP
jgi:AcrR family transcriptional regulator